MRSFAVARGAAIARGRTPCSNSCEYSQAEKRGLGSNEVLQSKGLSLRRACFSFSSGSGLKEISSRQIRRAGSSPDAPAAVHLLSSFTIFSSNMVRLVYVIADHRLKTD